MGRRLSYKSLSRRGRWYFSTVRMLRRSERSQGMFGEEVHKSVSLGDQSESKDFERVGRE